MKRQLRRKILKFLLTVLSLILIAGLGYYFLSQLKVIRSHYSDGNGDGSTEEDRRTELSDEESTSLYFDESYYSTSDQITSYLFIGTDASGEDKDADSKYRYTMADFLLLAVVNQTQHTYGFLQIDRNTITDVDILDENNQSKGSASEQICTAHGYGTDSKAGCENTVAAVEYLLGFMEINGYYSLNMNEIGSLNHLVGGVEVTLEDDFTQVDSSMKKGARITLSDTQAEHYVHDRMNVADGTNKNRMARQQQYLKGFMTKLKSQLQTSPEKTNEIYRTFANEADTNLTEANVSKIFNELYKYEDLGIFTLEGTTKEGEILGDGEVHEEFYPEESSKIAVMCQLMNLTKDDE